MQNGGPLFGSQNGPAPQLPMGGNFNTPAGAADRNIRSVLPPVDRSAANIEAERGETVWGDFDGDNLPEHFKIGGERHSNGGTPLQVPEGSFVFSDTKKLKIGGPIVGEFGKNPDNKKKYTFAQLARQYDVNPFKVLMNDPDSDRKDRDTAELMLDNYQRKLAKLALVQEGMKGFPQGIPSIAAPLFNELEGQGIPQAAMGGLVKAQLGKWITPVSQQYPSINPFTPWQKPAPALLPQATPPVTEGINPFIPWQMQTTQQHPANWVTVANQEPPAPSEVEFHPVDFPNAGRIRQTAHHDANRPDDQDGQGTDDAQTRKLYDFDFNPITKGHAVYPGYLSKDKNADVPVTQHARTNGTYGTTDWDMTDFFQRHPWVKQQRPGFDPSKEGDVKWFQNAYNDRYRNIWGYNYFNGKGHMKIDGKFGQGTYSTPALDEAGDPQASASTKTSKTKEEVKKQDDHLTPNSFNPSAQNGEWTPWWVQDEINLGAAYRNRYGLHKYMPSYISPDAVLPNAVYYDPARAIAANQEAAAQQNAVSSLYAGAQRLRSVGSNIQGQSGNLAAGILGDYNNRNVGVANQLAGIRAEIRNNVGYQKAKAMEDFLAKNTIANQQYDNAVALANNDIRLNQINGMTNQERTSWVNAMNPRFKINPGFDEYGRPGMLTFKGGKSLNEAGLPAGNDNSLTLLKANYDKFMRMFPNADENKALEYAQKMTFGNKGADLTDPAMQSLLQQYG